MVSMVSRPGVLSLAGGLPAPELFPREALSGALSKALREDPGALQYGGANQRLKEQVVGLAAERGITAKPEEIVITTGAQQGIELCVRAFLEQGGGLLLDELSYTGIHQSAALRLPKWAEVPVDLTLGSDPAAARQLLSECSAGGESMPDLAYLITDAHNPLGVSLSEERRVAWAQLLSESGIPVIEDDPYGLLWFDEPFADPLKARIPEWTLYLGSFSKILAPGLRLGFMIVPAALAEKIGVVKESADLESSGLIQRAVSTVLEGDFLSEHLARLRSVYRERRASLLDALDKHMPEDATWTQPQGGLFVWVEFGRDIDTAELLRRCLDRGLVAFLPGAAFALPGSRAVERARRSMRLSFSSLAPDVFDRAIATIVRALEEPTR